MRKALVVGINYYKHAEQLFGCVDDAHAVKAVLERHSDGSINFDVKVLTGTGELDPVARVDLRTSAKALFADDGEIALFYYAGHGHLEETGGYLMTSECEAGDAGFALNELMLLANQSPARNKIVVLDTCHSGDAGSGANTPRVSALAEGMTILTASTKEQYASEENGSGVFTTLLIDAMSGAASNLVGDITPGSIYAHIDQSLGSWEQRPVFKTNVKNFVSLRKVQPSIATAELRQLVDFFPVAGSTFALDPSFEPEPHGRPEGAPPPNPENTRKFAILQRFNRVNLVVPVDAPHMWHAAIESKSCRLTVLGEHYRRLVERKRI